MRISVGPPVLTINHGRTFMVTDLSSQIRGDRLQGLFCDDTRFLSYYACYLDGHPWVRLSSTTTAYYAAQIYLLNPVFTTEEGTISQGTVSLVISRVVENGMRTLHSKRCLTTTRCSSIHYR